MRASHLMAVGLLLHTAAFALPRQPAIVELLFALHELIEQRVDTLPALLGLGHVGLRLLCSRLARGRVRLLGAEPPAAQAFDPAFGRHRIAAGVQFLPQLFEREGGAVLLGLLRFVLLALVFEQPAFLFQPAPGRLHLGTQLAQARAFAALAFAPTAGQVVERPFAPSHLIEPILIFTA